MLVLELGLGCVAVDSALVLHHRVHLHQLQAKGRLDLCQVWPG